jgi:hypothetical protein
MALLTVQRPSVAGVVPTYANASASDTFQNDGKVFLHVKSTDAGSCLVTVKSGPTSNNVCSFGVANAAHDLTVTVAAGTERMIGPFDMNRFNDQSTNLVTVTFGVTGATIKVAPLKA